MSEQVDKIESNDKMTKHLIEELSLRLVNDAISKSFFTRSEIKKLGEKNFSKLPTPLLLDIVDVAFGKMVKYFLEQNKGLVITAEQEYREQNSYYKCHADCQFFNKITFNCIKDCVGNTQGLHVIPEENQCWYTGYAKGNKELKV
jgi:hypothetical protein